MEDSDVVQIEDVLAARSATTRTARRVLVAAALAGPIAGIAVFAFVYLLYGQARFGLGLFIAGIFVLLGLFSAVRWSRHYSSIGRQLDALERRVKRGERALGSQVRFR